MQISIKIISGIYKIYKTFKITEKNMEENTSWVVSACKLHKREGIFVHHPTPRAENDAWHSEGTHSC